MDSIAVVIPTYGRYAKLAEVSRNVHSTTTTPHTLYFICEQNDTNSQAEVKRLGDQCIVVNAKCYVWALNAGYHATKEPYVFCGSDDIVFTNWWDIKMLAKFENPAIGIVGAKDEWTITKTGLHSSHFMVRREYIEKQSGVFDEPNVVYSSQYRHSMCDIETEQTAMMRKAWVMSDAFISHNHWYMKTAPMDATYQHDASVQKLDEDTYNRRRKYFEQYYFERLFHGKVVKVNQLKLSVVLASYNQMPYLKKTVESLYEQTYHPFELIIIDDNSNTETKEYLMRLHDEKHCLIVFHDKQKYVNATWNEGVKLATGDCVAVINNDITFSKHWDVFILNAMLEEEVWLANPFQTDDGMLTPYGRHERSGNINIRGACWVIKKKAMEEMGYIPEQLKIWFGDSWLAWEVENRKKKSVFVPEAVIHHYGSRASKEMDTKDITKTFWWILRGDAYAFQTMTGQNVDKWIKIIEGHIEGTIGW